MSTISDIRQIWITAFIAALNSCHIILSKFNVTYNRNDSINLKSSSYHSSSMFNLLLYIDIVAFFFCLYECLTLYPINVTNQIWYQIQKQHWFRKSTNERNIYFSILVWEFKAISISSYSFYNVIYALAYTCA